MAMGPTPRAGQEEVPAGVPAGTGLAGAASAPAKCILLGEHAVVYGEPCLSLAVERRTRVAAAPAGDGFLVNGRALDRHRDAFLASAVGVSWPGGAPLRFRVRSRVPAATGLGSSAALSVAAMGALARLSGAWDEARIAQNAFQAERAAQGAGSPNDTSVSAAGGTVYLAPEPAQEGALYPLWTVERDNRTWVVHRAPAAAFADGARWVVGTTGVKAVTRTQVAKVRRTVEGSAAAREAVAALGVCAREGVDALRGADATALGRLMDRAQTHLAALGASHPALDRLIGATRAAPGTLGAKLTGAGGGGAMIALTSDPKAALTAIRAAGGTAFELRPAAVGVRPEPADETALGEAAPDKEASA